MIDAMYTVFTCPHCGFSHSAIISEAAENRVIFCDPEDGGCGRHFVVFLKVNVDTRVCKFEEGQEGLTDA